MQEKGYEVLKRITETVPKLDANKQNYILGLAEGMALAKQENKEKEQCVTS